MSALAQQVIATQRRLWLNRFIAKITFCAAVVTLGFGLIWLTQRLFDLHWPLTLIGAGLAAVSVIAAAIWTASTREDSRAAAARLDEAAGLRERVSTSQYCSDPADEFAEAVVADAERAVRGIQVRRLIRLSPPPQWGWAVAALLFVIVPLLVPVGILKPAEARVAQEKKTILEATKVTVKQQMDELRDLTEKTPALDDLKAKDDELDLGAAGKEQSPADIRHEALKKIDRYEDAIKQKRNSDRYDALSDAKKMMRAVKPPESQEAPTQKLAQALQQGDFKSAKEEVEKLKEQLATLKSEEDKEMAEKIAQQLDELSKQLEKVAQDEKLMKELEQAGIKKEDVEKMLERLSKKDLEQLQKKLEQSGMSKEQAQNLAKKLEQKQGGKSMADKLAKSMKGSASAAKAGDAENAAEQLSQASQQLSELEQMEQELSQLDAAANAAADAKKSIEQQCPS